MRRPAFHARRTSVQISPFLSALSASALTSSAKPHRGSLASLPQKDLTCTCAPSISDAGLSAAKAVGPNHQCKHSVRPSFRCGVAERPSRHTSDALPSSMPAILPVEGVLECAHRRARGAPMVKSARENDRAHM